MNKSEDRRAEIIEQLADYVLAEGLSASSLRPLAEAAGTSDRMLLYYFKDKADLMAATLDCVATRLAVQLEHQTAQTPLPYDELQEKLLGIVRSAEHWPYMSVFLEVGALAARGDEFYRTVGGQTVQGFLLWIASQLDAKDEAARMAGAASLLRVVEGTVVLRALGVDDDLR